MKKRTYALMMSAIVVGLLMSGCTKAGEASESQEAAESTEISEAANETDKAADVSAEASAENGNADETNENDVKTDREVINQVSLLQGLTFGDYYGSKSAAEVKEMGDIGIGTFDKLNGELIMLDGIIYRAAGDGSVEAVDDSETIPFCDVTFFDEDESQELTKIKDLSGLKEALDEKASTLGTNRFYMVRIDGTFNEMHVRSELAQEEPYKPLAKVLETDQTFFDYENIKGTIVGLYCPDYMDRLNAVGWHFHFVSEDRKCGGHIMELKFDEASAKWDSTSGFEMSLPDNDMFNSFDLTVDQSEDIKRVETGD